MSVRIVVREGESIASAVRRLQRAACFAQQRAWYKPSPGFYEKPSRLRQKRKYVDRKKHMGDGLFKDLYFYRCASGFLRRSEPLLSAFQMPGIQGWLRRKVKRLPEEYDSEEEEGVGSA